MYDYEEREILEKLPPIFFGAPKEIYTYSEYYGRYRSGPCKWMAKYSFNLKEIPLELKVSVNISWISGALYKQGYVERLYSSFSYSLEEFEEKTIDMLEKYTKELLKEKEIIEKHTDEVVNFFKLNISKDKGQY